MWSNGSFPKEGDPNIDPKLLKTLLFMGTPKIVPPTLGVVKSEASLTEIQEARALEAAARYRRVELQARML